MPLIQIGIENKIAHTVDAPYIVCGNSDYTVKFTFDGEWNAYKAKTMCVKFYRCGKKECYEVLFEGDTASIPAIYDTDEVEIGVYAGDIRTTTGARIPCLGCIRDGNHVHADPPKDVYDQLMELLSGAQGSGEKPVAVALLLSPAVTADGDIIGNAEKEDENVYSG